MKLKKEPKKILVIRLSSLGDIVVLTPIFKSLKVRFPEAQIDFLVKKEFKSIIVKNPYLSNIMTFDTNEGLRGWNKLCRSLSGENYDLFIDMHNNFRSWILNLFLFKVPRLRYYKPRLLRFLLFYFLINFFPKSFSLLGEYFKVLKPLGIDSPDSKPEIFLPDLALEKAKSILENKGVKSPFVTILPVAAWSNKRYPLMKYEELAKRINNELNITVVWLGGKKDSYLNDLKYLEQGKSVEVIGETDLEESLGILCQSFLVVGNDTGLTYSAEALGIPVVLILGPTSRETGAGHYYENSVTLQKDIWCRPCSQKGDRKCYRKKQYCMEGISSDEIFKAVRKIIEREDQ